MASKTDENANLKYPKEEEEDNRFEVSPKAG